MSSNYPMNSKLGGDPKKETIRLIKKLRKVDKSVVDKINGWVKKDIDPKGYLYAFALEFLLTNNKYHDSMF